MKDCLSVPSVFLAKYNRRRGVFPVMPAQEIVS